MSDGREPRAVSRSPSPDVEKRARLEVVDLGGRTDVDSESGAILDVEVDRVATVVATDPGAAIDGVDGVMSVPTRTSDSDDDEEEDDELSESDEEPYADGNGCGDMYTPSELQSTSI